MTNLLQVLAVEEPDDDYFECSDEQASEESKSPDLVEPETDAQENLIHSSRWSWDMNPEERWTQLQLLEDTFWNLVIVSKHVPFFIFIQILFGRFLK